MSSSHSSFTFTEDLCESCNFVTVCLFVGKTHLGDLQLLSLFEMFLPHAVHQDTLTLQRWLDMASISGARVSKPQTGEQYLNVQLNTYLCICNTIAWTLTFSEVSSDDWNPLIIFGAPAHLHGHPWDLVAVPSGTTGQADLQQQNQRSNYEFWMDTQL